MEMNWRIGAGSAGLAFIISVFFGILGGVQAGVVLLRALFGSLLFAALGLGAHAVMRKFLPELFEGFSGKESGLGEGVDIVIQDEENEAASSTREGVNEVRNPRNHGNHGNQEDREREEDEAEYDSLVEEIEEVTASDTAESGAPQVSTNKKETTVRQEAVEPVENLDALPDLGALETSFVSPSNDLDAGAEAVTYSAKTPEGDSLGGGQDPAVLAKVVQTILKKGNKE